MDYLTLRSSPVNITRSIYGSPMFLGSPPWGGHLLIATYHVSSGVQVWAELLHVRGDIGRCAHAVHILGLVQRFVGLPLICAHADAHADDCPHAQAQAQAQAQAGSWLQIRWPRKG